MAHAPKKDIEAEDENYKSNTEISRKSRGGKSKAEAVLKKNVKKNGSIKAKNVKVVESNGKISPKSNGKATSPKAGKVSSPRANGKSSKGNRKATGEDSEIEGKTATKAKKSAGSKTKKEKSGAETRKAKNEQAKKNNKAVTEKNVQEDVVIEKGPAPSEEKSDLETKEKLDKKRGRKRKTDSAEDQSKKPKIVVERQKLPSGSGVCLTLGQGDTGQLGLGEDIMERSKPALVKSIPVKVASVEAGGMHTLALSVEGVVYSFGCNDEGALGRAIEDDEEGFTPGEVKIDEKIVQVSAGDSHSVALSEGGNVYYWGTFRDSSGSFGLTPDGSVQKLPVALAHHLDVAKISSGSDHIALLTTAGQLYTLGCGEQGQLGRVGERFTARGGRRGLELILVPEVVRSKNRRVVFTDVWAGSYDTLAQTEKNEVLACGLNNYNQLGISKGMVFHTFAKSKGLSEALGNQKWRKIAFGQHHALCLDAEGRVWAIGRADYGRLGLGQADTTDGKADAKVPVVVPGLEGQKCIDIACGTCVSFAVTEDGKCFSWGMGTNGQLGHGGEEDAWEPVEMGGKQLETRSVIGVDAGGQHTILVASESGDKQ